MYTINKLNYEFDFPYSASQNLFDKCILPILTYGSQIWGIEVKPVIENVQLKYCKKQLGVGSTTPTVAVLGECAVFPIYIQCCVNVIKFWLKILSIRDGSLLRSCYDMLVTYAEAGRKNWASSVRDMLYMYGFGYIWEQQNVDDVRSFISSFEDRLRDSYIQNWHSLKEETSKLYLYNLYKHEFEMEPYLSLNIPSRLRKYLARFRSSCVNLEIEIGRRQGIERGDRLCKFCGERNRFIVEDEFHVLMECPAYTESRNIYLGRLDVNIYSFCEIMSSNHVNDLIRLANFICSIFEIRNMNMMYL